jgi:hypothetical protein
MKETMMQNFEVWVGDLSMSECLSKLAVEGLEFLILTSIHREGFVFWGVRSGPSGVWVGFEGCISNSG